MIGRPSYHTELLHLERTAPARRRDELSQLHSKLPSSLWYTQSTQIQWTEKLRAYTRERHRNGLTYAAIAAELNEFYSTNFFTRGSIARAINGRNGRGE